MNKTIQYAVAGALLTGVATAQAQSLPSSNNSDLWLFVSAEGSNTTFAEDTGFSINSLVPAADLLPSGSTNASLNSTAISARFTLAASSALTAYLNAAASAGETIEWAVEAYQYNGTTSTTPNKPGGQIGITVNSASTSAQTAIAGLTPGANFSPWAGGFQGDISYLVGSGGSNYTAGGKSYAYSLGSSVGQVWGGAGTGNTGDNAGSTNLYGQGPDTENIALGSLEDLYAVTGNGSASNPVQSYILGTNLTLTTGGTLEVGTIPLPAAVWLFGSGLLGLIGVGRRRMGAA